MKMFNILIFIATTVTGQMVGSQKDDHNCVLDGGYQWCEFTQSCQRPWESPCIETMVHPIDPLIDPVMRPSGCQFSRCPPPAPCPRPAISVEMGNCRMVTDNDHCGCVIGCPHYDCTNDYCNSDSDCHVDQFCRQTTTMYPVNGRRGLQNSECVDKVGINETCGGYTPPEFQTRCLDNLECVNTMGPMIADAPGQCLERCQMNELRNEYGICIYPTNAVTIPDNCATWYDGCNTCQVTNGRADICTMMYCFRQSDPICITYYRKNILHLGDICYRFCEDGSQESVNRRNDCPVNTECKPVSVSMVSYDSCDSRAWTCLTVGH